MKTFDADLIPTPFDEEMGKLLHATFGKSRPFHAHFGYYADIIRPCAIEEFRRAGKTAWFPCRMFQESSVWSLVTWLRQSAKRAGQKISS